MFWICFRHKDINHVSLPGFYFWKIHFLKEILLIPARFVFIWSKATFKTLNHHLLDVVQYWWTKILRENCISTSFNTLRCCSVVATIFVVDNEPKLWFISLLTVHLWFIFKSFPQTSCWQMNFTFLICLTQGVARLKQPLCSRHWLKWMNK